MKITSETNVLLETSYTVAENTLNANLVSGKLMATVNADTTATSVATVTYNNVYSLTGALSADRSFEVTFETPATLVKINNSSLVLVNQPLNIEARINETPGEVLIRVNPNEDLKILFSRLPTGEVALNADIYKLVLADVQLVKGVFTGDMTVIDTDIKMRITQKDAQVVVTGENLNVTGSASTGKFNVTMTAPTKASVDFKNEAMVVATGSRSYTMTSENGLIKVLPKMRSA